MITETRIYPNGQLKVEVIDRQQHLCSEIYRLTERVGKQLSDEELPDGSCSIQTESSSDS